MNILEQGGLMMWPILALSILSLAVIAERFLAYTTRRFPSPDKLDPALALFRDNQAESALKHIEDAAPFYAPLFAAFFSAQPVERKEKDILHAGEGLLFALNRRLEFLATVATAAPLMGLLGTVIGMISTFSNLSASGNVDITLLASGIWQALLTTAAGLAVALPALLAHRWFCNQYEKTAYAMQHAANVFLDQLKTPGDGA
jgi:biopolymer transport protein ExbB